MSVAINSNSMSWPTLSDQQRTTSHSQTPEQLAPRNNIEFTREMLTNILEHLSTVIASEFSGVPLRLVAHGGACMLLHPGLHELANRKAMYHSTKGEDVARRTTTRDVDYIHRSFVAEYAGCGIPDAGERLKRCIRATALHFRLGADWMNSDADVALPMACDPGTGAPYDPIYAASVQPNNIRLYTVFTSRNSKLTLINVTPFWAVALKLVRYAKWDPGDICLLLLNGTSTRGVKWSAEIIETWIRQNCSAMGYDNYDTARVIDMKHKIAHAVQMLSTIGGSIMSKQDREEPGLSRMSSPISGGAAAAAVASQSWNQASKDLHSTFISPPPGTSSMHRSSSSTHLSLPGSQTWSSSPAPSPAFHTSSSTPGNAWHGPASSSNALRSRNDSMAPRMPEAIEEPERFIPSYYGEITHTTRKQHQVMHKLPDEKRSSRREKERSRHRRREESRRSKYMLRAEEPDDSDEEEDESTDTDTDTDERSPHSGRGLRSQSWVPSRSQHLDRSFEQQHLVPVHSNHRTRSWTQNGHLNQEPMSSLSVSPHHSPLPSNVHQSQSHFHPTHSQTWPLPSQMSRSMTISQQLDLPLSLEHISIRHD